MAATPPGEAPSGTTTGGEELATGGEARASAEGAPADGAPGGGASAGGAPAAGGEESAAERCERARRFAEEGDLETAAAIFEEVVRGDAEEQRAEAALGLAVALQDLGDHEGAREADRAAMATRHPEYGPRAAYHLALLCRREGDDAGERDSWAAVLDAGHTGYAPAAHYGLGRLADAGGRTEEAARHWRAAVDSGDPIFASAAAHDLAGRLFDAGEAEEALAVAEAGLAAGEFPPLRLLLGIMRLEQALHAFTLAADSGDPEVTPLAVELLARGLPLRGDDEAADEMWARGLSHPDPDIAADVHARLRRGFPIPPPQDPAAPDSDAQDWDTRDSDTRDSDQDLTAADSAGPSGASNTRGLAEGADNVEDPGHSGGPGGVGGPLVRWWEPYLETAVRSGSLPLLAGEAFGALDRMYTLLAVPYAQAPATGSRRNRSDDPALRDAAGEALRLPSEYVWGDDLHASFRERLRRALGSATDVLPPTWPHPPTP